MEQEIHWTYYPKLSTVSRAATRETCYLYILNERFSYTDSV